MVGTNFDAWTRRRFGLAAGGVAASWLGLTVRISDVAEARKSRKKKRRKKPKLNEFGCVNVGTSCRKDKACCSGICNGKQGKKKCRAHGSGGCGAGHTAMGCGGQVVGCITSSGEDGVCVTTTGQAGYCMSDRTNAVCSRDADCHELYGPEAACILCPTSPSGTNCVGPTQ